MLIVIGLGVLAVAFRSCRNKPARKLGAAIFLAASFFLIFFLTKCVWCGLLGIAAWFFLPWIELLTRVRKMRLPVENRLTHREPPGEEFFPNASKAIDGMTDEHFDHVEDAAWKWSGMEQYFRIFWNPEERASATLCLCEQERVAFAFITISSKTVDGRVYRTTNFPFSPTLAIPPAFHWNHVPCERNCFHEILRDHRAFLARKGVDPDELLMPDPEHLTEEIETEMKAQIDYNLQNKLIERDGEGNFRYSVRGLLFLWKQFAKDMIRLC
ncbi:MAG: hypothetical protein Q7Q71_09720 [Verrucomicrobiota bacterium JB023]|nr:hypothetical protein [Verrucomicrobiota bacterium JB023]